MATSSLPTFVYLKLAALSYGLLATFKSHLITGLDRPLGLQEFEASRISRRHMKVVRLSVLRTDRLYPPEDIPGTHFC